MKVRDIIKLVERDGWQHVRTTGSHRRKPGTVTIPGHLSDDLAIGTEVSIFKQAGLKRR